MKKIMLVLVLSLLLSSMSMSFAQDSMQNAKIEDRKQEIATITEFALWSNSKLSFDSVVYNTQGEKLLNLYSVVNEHGVIGYMLIDVKTGIVAEFALGESPFESVFERTITKKSIQSIKNKNVKLIRAGARYFLTEDNFSSMKNLRSSDLDNINSLYAVDKTLSKQTNIVEPKSMWMIIKL